MKIESGSEFIHFAHHDRDEGECGLFQGSQLNTFHDRQA
jgi:hypothetical protein